MKLVLVALLVALASCSTNLLISKRVPASVIDTSFLKDAKKSPMPITLAQITSSLKQNDATAQEAETLQNHLDGFLEDIAESRETRLQTIRSVRDQCAEEEEFRQNEIDEGQRAALAAQTQLNLCTAQGEQAQYLNNLAESALEVYNQELADLASIRADQNRAYQRRLAQYQDLQTALVEVSNKLDEYEVAAQNAGNSPTFIQTTNKLFQRTVSTGLYALVMPIYSKLIQMHSRQTSFDVSDVSTVRALLEQLASNVVSNIEGINQQEATEQATYNDKVAATNAIISRLTTQVAKTHSFIATMNDCLNQENTIVALSRDKISRNTDLLDSSRQLCQASEESWRLSELSRVRVTSIVNALKTAVGHIERQYRAQILAPTVEEVST